MAPASPISTGTGTIAQCCPILVYPATSEREKISFHQINSKTGNRVRLKRVDEETGHEVPYDDIIKGYEVAKGHYIEVTD